MLQSIDQLTQALCRFFSFFYQYNTIERGVDTIDY